MCRAGPDGRFLELDDLALYRWRRLRDDLGRGGKCADVQRYLAQPGTSAGSVYDGLLRRNRAWAINGQQTADRPDERSAVGNRHGPGGDPAAALYTHCESEQ